MRRLGQPLPITCLSVSIHAPGRGATLLDMLGYGFRFVSIHAPGRGATRFRELRCRWDKRFNSRTREGCDIIQVVTNLKVLSFNSRTREGCDSSAVRSRETKREFQFTHPGGVRLA